MSTYTKSLLEINLLFDCLLSSLASNTLRLVSRSTWYSVHIALGFQEENSTIVFLFQRAARTFLRQRMCPAQSVCLAFPEHLIQFLRSSNQEANLCSLSHAIFSTAASRSPRARERSIKKLGHAPNFRSELGEFAASE